MRRRSWIILPLISALFLTMVAESSDAAPFRLIGGRGRLGMRRSMRHSGCSSCGCNASASQQLFNGKDLTGWDGNPEIWSVEDGVIVGQSTAKNPVKKNTFLIWQGDPVQDFELTFKYRLPTGVGNSGIQYRSEDKGGWVVHGYQADFEAGPKYSGIVYDEKGRGILALRGEKVTIDADGKKHAEQFADTEQLQAFIKPEDWNEYRVTARGNDLIHQINGHTTADLTDNDKSRRESGILALQLHAGPPMRVEFKDIELTPLAP